MVFDVSGWRDLKNGIYFDRDHVSVLRDGLISGRMDGSTSGREFSAPSGQVYQWQQIFYRDADRICMTVAVDLPPREIVEVKSAPAPFQDGAVLGERVPKTQFCSPMIDDIPLGYSRYP